MKTILTVALLVLTSDHNIIMRHICKPQTKPPLHDTTRTRNTTKKWTHAHTICTPNTPKMANGNTETINAEFYTNCNFPYSRFYVRGPNFCKICELACHLQRFPLNSYIFIQYSSYISSRIFANI